MKTGKDCFVRSLLNIALPVTLQSLLQSSFGVVDQVMIGQLGSESIAGIGLGGKFASVYVVVLGAVAAAAGIMAAQYVGAENRKGLAHSFYLNLLTGSVIAAIFMTVCILFPGGVMSLYTKENEVGELAELYLRIYAFSFLPMAVSSMMSVMLRCMEAAVAPLFAGMFSVLLNTGLNYLLIFGRYGFPALGVKGAAIASVAAQMAGLALTSLFFVKRLCAKGMRLPFDLQLTRQEWMGYLGILAPILACEFLWSLGENVYAAIYGRLGTGPCAAMTMTGPIQGLMMGALSGLSQAAGIMIGKLLGNGEYERAYSDSKRLMKYGFWGSVILSALLFLTGKRYVAIYNVDLQVQAVAFQLLVVFALVSPVKVQNMILGGGIIRSGGMTRYVMWIDMIGTWGFGVPLGLVAAFVWKLQIPYVYFMLSLEEVVRLLTSLSVFRRRGWMRRLEQ